MPLDEANNRSEVTFSDTDLHADLGLSNAGGRHEDGCDEGQDDVRDAEESARGSHHDCEPGCQCYQCRNLDNAAVSMMDPPHTPADDENRET